MQKVMNDIVSTMFNRRFIEEIFQKHQPIHSRRVNSFVIIVFKIFILSFTFSALFKIKEALQNPSGHAKKLTTQVLKTMFDKLAHASIMRLNSNSMDKLYDLMTMAVKYQVTKTKT